MAFRVLPRALRPTSVWRLAEPLLGGVKDPEFEVLLRRIDAAPIHRGNDVAVFFEGPPAFAAMCAAIAVAEREVLLEAYILKDDATGRAFVDALAATSVRSISTPSATSSPSTPRSRASSSGSSPWISPTPARSPGPTGAGAPSSTSSATPAPAPCHRPCDNRGRRNFYVVDSVNARVRKIEGVAVK